MICTDAHRPSTLYIKTTGTLPVCWMQDWGIRIHVHVPVLYCMVLPVLYTAQCYTYNCTCKYKNYLGNCYFFQITDSHSCSQFVKI